MANFIANKEIAQSETFSSGPIKTTGIHKGHFTKAYVRRGQAPGAKSEAIHFEFSSTSGGYGSFDIWYQGRDGAKSDRGIAQIHGLMELLGIDELKEKKNDKIDVYDWELRATRQITVDSYPALLNKFIGTVWQAEEYIKQDKKDGQWVDTDPPVIRERAVFLRFCDAETHASALEVINGADPVAIDAYVAGLPEIKRVNASNQAARAVNIDDQARNQPATQSFDDFDDDIQY